MLHLNRTSPELRWRSGIAERRPWLVVHKSFTYILIQKLINKTKYSFSGNLGMKVHVRQLTDICESLLHHVFLLKVLILPPFIDRPSVYNQVALTVRSSRSSLRLDRTDLIRHKVVANHKVTLGHVKAFLSDVSCYQQVAPIWTVCIYDKPQTWCW